MFSKFICPSVFLIDSKVWRHKLPHYLNTPTQVLVQNIALADLGYTLVVPLPTIFTTTLMSDTWTLGDGTCHAIGVVQFFFAVADITMVCSLTICKLLCLLFPLRSSIRSTKSGYILVLFLWILSLLYPLEIITLNREIVYDTELYRCVTGDRVGAWKALIVINNAVLMLIPLLVILVTTVWLLVVIKRVKTTNNQGVFVVLTVASVFSLSWCPMLSFNFVHLFARPSTTYYKIAAFSIFINTASNPFLYMLTSRSFKEFIISRMLRGLTFKPSRQPASANTNGAKCDEPMTRRSLSVISGNVVVESRLAG